MSLGRDTHHCLILGAETAVHGGLHRPQEDEGRGLTAVSTTFFNPGNVAREPSSLGIQDVLGSCVVRVH